MFMLRPRLNFLNGHGLLLSKRLFASQAEVDGFFNDALALAGKDSKEIYRLALPLTEPFKRPATLEPASFYKDGIEEKLEINQKGKLYDLKHYCDAVETKEEAEEIPKLIEKYHALYSPNSFVVTNAAIKKLIQLNLLPILLDMLQNQSKYALIPTPRAFNFILFRYAIEILDDPTHLDQALQIFQMFEQYRCTPSPLTRELLFYCYLNSKSEENYSKYIDYLSSQSFPHVPKGISKLESALKESNNTALLETFNKVIQEKRQKLVQKAQQKQKQKQQKQKTQK